MGNFPYPSTYILNGGGEMPAFPVRVACESMRAEDMSAHELLPAFADSLGIFYNYSKARTAWHAASSIRAELCRGTDLTCNGSQALQVCSGCKEAGTTVALAGCGVL